MSDNLLASRIGRRILQRFEEDRETSLSFKEFITIMEEEHNEIKKMYKAQQEIYGELEIDHIDLSCVT